MQISNVKSVLIGIGAAAAAIAITGAASGSGIGAVFNLGKTNTVNATSRLKGSTMHPMLSVTNNGTGTALSLQVAQGKPPFSVNSPVRVANLNASLLGGLAASQFVQGGGQSRSFGFRMSTATDATKTLLSVPGFGTVNVLCGGGNAGLAQVRFTTGTHAMDLFHSTLTSDTTQFLTASAVLSPNQTYDLGAFSAGVGHGNWQRLILRYATGHHLGFLITHIATIDIMLDAEPKTCEFDASAVIGPGTTGP